MLSILDQSKWTLETANHLLCRAGFGGSPAERRALFELGRDEGIEAAVDSMVDPEVNWDAYPPPEVPPIQQSDLPHVYQRERQWDFVGWYLQQTSEITPAAGKMLKFWVDHFPIDLEAIRPIESIYPYFYRHFDLLRRDALGNFEHLLKQVSWSEGMMRMLDLFRSKRGAINENFARELLELFTMGVHGGYTEADVLACAKAFTGRKLTADSAYLDESTITTGPNAGEYSDIDPEERQFLVIDDPANPGVPVPGILPRIKKPRDQQPGDPKEQGDIAIDIILAHPQTGRHLAWKMWRYFASPEPSDNLVDALGTKLRVDCGYDIKKFLKLIFRSEEFYQPEFVGNQIKDPIDYVVSTAKQLQTQPLAKEAATFVLNSLDQNLVSPPNIAGWPEPEVDGNAWINGGTLLTRMSLSSLWSHDNVEVIRDWTILPSELRSERAHPAIDFDRLVPKAIRNKAHLPLIIDRLADAVFPAHKLSGARKRILIQHFRRSRGWYSTTEILKELTQILLALPEAQLQ